MRVPDEVRRLYSQWSWSLAYQHIPDVVTWRLEGGDGRVLFVKTAPTWWPVPLSEEAKRLRWARAHGLPVPQVVGSGTDTTMDVDWLVTAALPGRDATDSRHGVDAEGVVRLLAGGLRWFHAAPVAACPFGFGLETALVQAHARVRAGLVAVEDLHPEHVHLTPEAALAELQRLRPDSEDLVVCHGDYCLPNVLIDNDDVVGFVDLGRLAVADRWWDLAVGSWSIARNLGSGWEGLFLDSYGVARDDGRMAFYRLLYDVVA